MRVNTRNAAGGRLTSRLWLIAGLAVTGMFLVQVARFWHPVYGFTRFLQLDATNDETKISAFKTNPVYVYRDTGGYDGLYYAEIAYHPTLQSPELAPSVDSLSYRARRILPPALAWIIAAGRPALIANVYSVLNVGAWLALAFLLWRLFAVREIYGFVAWCGLLGSAGALGSVRYALTDLIALVFIAVAMFAQERGRRVSPGGFMAAAALSRETSILAIGGAITKPWLSRRNFGLAIVAMAPLALWLTYVRWQLGPAEPGWGNFAAPLSGLITKLIFCFQAATHPSASSAALAWSTLAAAVGAGVQATFVIRATSNRDPWWRIGVAYVGLMVVLGHAVWEGFPGAFTRVLLPLALAFNVLALRRRASLAWLIAGNLSVFSGIIMITDVHHDTRELAAAHVGRVPIVATVGEGWFGVERAKNHAWSWSAQQSSVLLRSWSQKSLPVKLGCKLRSLTSRQIKITQNGVTLWQGQAGPSLTAISFQASLENGKARLDVSSDEPATAENGDGSGRRLAFAIYDVQLQLPQSPQ